MNKEQIDFLKSELNIDLTKEKKVVFDNYARIFLEKNSRLNLISKNDEKFLFEKHIFDSLAFSLFLDKFKLETKYNLLDIGTGGGFPSVPLAIMYENMNIYPLDSIRKKINTIKEIKSELNLKNLFPLCERAEKIEQKFDYITSRAVASMEIILKYALPLLKKEGYFIAYKSKKAQEELKDAQKVLKKYKAKVLDVIEYKLPVEQKHHRNLIIVSC